MNRFFMFEGHRRINVRTFLINRLVVAAALSAALLFVSAHAWAQSAQSGGSPDGSFTGANAGRTARHASSEPPSPTPRTPDGKPDFSGIWDGGGGNINRDLPGKQLPYTPAGEAAYQYNMTKAIDPQSLCIIIGEPRADVDGRPFEIVQNSTRVAFLFERDASRRVIRIGSQHPADPEPSFFGDAVGTWDGDTLVVDVVGLKGEKVWADNVGHPHSDATHLIERWSRPDANTLLLQLTIEDPKYYTKPITFTRKLRRQPWDEVDEEACDENNVDRDHLGPGLGTKDGTRGFDRSLTGSFPAAAPSQTGQNQ
jgi:hypothetical protein